MNVIIIEDEAAAYNNMKLILQQLEPAIEITGSFDTVTESVLWLKNNPAPDLIFMDIQLADGSSFNIFECINIDSPVIFTTAYDEYAVKAFQVNSIDYLLKPITVENMRRALDKYRRISQFNFKKTLGRFENAFRPESYMQRVLVPVKDKIIPVKTGSIAYFYNTDGMTELKTMDGCCYKIDKSLDCIIANLDPAQFIRANRQFIVSKNAVKDITRWFDSRLLINLSTGTCEPVYVSKNRASEFKRWFSL